MREHSDSAACSAWRAADCSACAVRRASSAASASARAAASAISAALTRAAASSWRAASMLFGGELVALAGDLRLALRQLGDAFAELADFARQRGALGLGGSDGIRRRGQRLVALLDIGARCRQRGVESRPVLRPHPARPRKVRRARRSGAPTRSRHRRPACARARDRCRSAPAAPPARPAPWQCDALRSPAALARPSGAPLRRRPRLRPCADPAAPIARRPERSMRRRRGR